MTLEEAVPEAEEPSVLAPDKPAAGTHPASCPVVGLGASAGGLEAFQTFLSSVPPDSGHAYVLVQHLDPNHESMLAELLSRRTAMPVCQAADGMAIEPNNVYLIPPNASLTIEKAQLRLSDFSEPRGFRRPIDVFFRSLAVDQGPNAACIVLSGTGGDGSEGLRAVKEAGGLTLVQEPDSAKYDGMPNSAVATGLVDKVLKVGEMPDALRDYFHRALHGTLLLPDVTDFLANVCEELRHRLGHDFSQYKSSTMLRRVQRRMQVVGAASAADYLERLRQNNHEAELLFRDLLINVTCFFRDAEAFNVLRRDVIPALLKDRSTGDIIRIWAPGCSSGEEAYSIAILMAEALSRSRARPTVQIFATDIDEMMLQKARAARYPHSAVRDVPLELLDRYFYAQEDDYVIAQAIRDMVRVSNHNLIKDPPFSRVDMVVCRNLLIYLNVGLQHRLIPVFHYALRTRGFLFLGSAENFGGRADLFETMDASARIFVRKGTQRQSVAMPLAVQPGFESSLQDRNTGTGNGREDLTTRRMVERYAPAHVVVDANNDVIRASTRTSKYLELAEGKPSTRVTDLAKRGLRSALRAILETARRSHKRTIKRDVQVDADDEHILVDLVADPLNDQEILIVFQDAASSREDAVADAQVDADAYSDEDRVKELEDELDDTRSRLRTTVEELETSNEELKSSNEEMMSMNEELQSTNEELATVNEELKNKLDQLARSNSDLSNFIDSTQIPTIVLDKKLRIRSFTPATKALFRFKEQDKGRPLSDLVARIDNRHLEMLAQKVLKDEEPIEEDFDLDPGKESFVLRVLPYRDANDAIDGVILVFTDVSKIRQTQADLARNEVIAQQRGLEIDKLYNTTPVGMALLDRNRRYLKINQHFAALDGAATGAHIGRTLQDMVPTLWERIDAPIGEVFDRGKAIVNLAVTVRLMGPAPQDLLVDLFPYDEDGQVTAVGIIVKDVTELRRLERELRRLMDELQHRVKNTLATVASIVNQTVSRKADRAELITTLKRRIGALAATHDLLTLRDWRDASLRQILESELTPFDHVDRIALKGPDVDLPPKHALSLTLTLHELATNAAKYGALSENGGKLTVEWSVNMDESGRLLTLKWEESGVKGIGDGKVIENFGTRLIKNAVIHDLRGTCQHDLRAGGLSCIITVPF